MPTCHLQTLASILPSTSFALALNRISYLENLGQVGADSLAQQVPCALSATVLLAADPPNFPRRTCVRNTTGHQPSNRHDLDGQLPRVDVVGDDGSHDCRVPAADVVP